MTRGTWIMLILCVLAERSINSELTGNHICQGEERYKVNVTKYEIRNMTVRRYEWCVQVPPRCSVYSVQRINVTKIEEEDRTRYVDKCCDGYYELDGRCSPNSCRYCKHGACGDDGICQCESGYWGDNCDKKCTDISQSRYCQNDCDNCIEGYCDIRTGNCTCPPNSIRCDLDCSGGRKCVKKCKCEAASTCDPFTQDCLGDNEDYIIEHDDYNHHSHAAKFEKTNVDPPPDLTKYHIDVTTPQYFPFVTISTLESTKNEDVNYLEGESEDDEPKKATSSTMTTEKYEKERSYTIGTQREPSSTENPFNDSSKFEVYVNKEFDVPNIIGDDRKISDDNDEISVNKQEESSARQASEESPKKVIIDSRLFITIISCALFIVFVIMTAAVFCMLHKLKAKKKKIADTMIESEGAKIRDSISSVSVTTRSIFHTPLPDPPIFENPAFSTQFENPQNKSGSGSVETHVVCNVNIPEVASQNHIKPVESPELFYDHPPSTGSYRPASIPEPPNPGNVKATFDPIYDEIPCNQRTVPISTPPPSYTNSEQSTLYMNTYV